MMLLANWSATIDSAIICGAGWARYTICNDSSGVWLRVEQAPGTCVRLEERWRNCPRSSRNWLRGKASVSNGWKSRLEPCEPLRERLLRALKDDCPLHLRDGGFIRDHYDPQLDELRQLASGGKQWIANYQAEQIALTGITSLKVGYTKVFGYYLEVTNTHREKIPAHFIRKQTLKNAERYITEELKEYETKVLSADEEALRLETELFLQLKDDVFQNLAILQQNAAVLAELDVLCGLAELARKFDYVRPELVDTDAIEIVEGRHPVLDATRAKGTFVPNDCLLGGQHGSIMLITGPNMAGKSTYIRQVALLTLMAQWVASFLPSAHASVSPIVSLQEWGPAMNFRVGKVHLWSRWWRPPAF